MSTLDPGILQDVRVESITSTSAVVGFSAPLRGNYDGAILILTSLQDEDYYPPGQEWNVSSPDTNYTLEDLKPSTSYNLSAKAFLLSTDEFDEQFSPEQTETFKTSFDKVPHQRLLSKLLSYGITGKTHRWISEFLTNRKQRLVVEGEQSEWVSVDSGVPQGTVTGPLFFLIYINDLPDGLNSTCRLSADDCIIYDQVSSMEDAHKVQNDLDRLEVVKKMLDKDGRANPFVDNKPGKRWWSSFRARHPQLVFRKPQPIGKERTAVTKNRIDKWFKELEDYLGENNARSILEEPNRLFNADESGFPLGGRASDRVLSLKGERVIQQFKNAEKGQVTVLVTACASGSFLPPMIVLPGRHGDGSAYQGAPRGAFFARTKNGWMDSKAFYGFIANLFQPYLVQMKVPLPVLLLVDGLSAHQTLEVAKHCEANRILLYRFPPNATHILQPCDVSVFRSLKASWNRAEEQFRYQNPGDYVTRVTFSRVRRRVEGASGEARNCIFWFSGSRDLPVYEIVS
nr:uncharacterized protein LOC129283361 [Lytechinus pictus]